MGPSRGRYCHLQNEAGAAHAALLKQLNDTEESARAAAERAAKQLADAKQADAEARAAAQQRHADAVAKGEARHAAAVEEGKVNVANTIARMERQKKGELEEQASLHEQNVARINSAHTKVGRGGGSFRVWVAAVRARQVDVTTGCAGWVPQATEDLEASHRQALAAQKAKMEGERREGERQLDLQKVRQRVAACNCASNLMRHVLTPPQTTTAFPGAAALAWVSARSWISKQSSSTASTRRLSSR